ncbi:MAG: hypothetical protein LBU67_09950 [Oscillospiraceae bacterium]|jgi:hypothetical protein|nr:hypothetical protein [Oscillospiraceae bacterium]
MQQHPPAEGHPPAKAAPKRRTLYQRLHLMPLSVGLLLGLVMAVASVPVGNGQELSRMVNKAMAFWQADAYVEGLTAQAANLIKIADRYPQADPKARQALAAAQVNERLAQGVADVQKAERELLAAMQKELAVLMASGVSPEDEHNIQIIATTFNDYRAKLHAMARDYNRVALLAVDAYDTMPFRWLFPRPALYDLGG